MHKTPSARPIPTPSRSRHNAAFRQHVLAQCEHSGRSIVAVARAHGLRPQLVYQWRHQAHRAQQDRQAQPSQPLHSFIPLTLHTPAPTLAPSTEHHLRIDLHRGALALTVHWPLAALTHLTTWLQGNAP